MTRHRETITGGFGNVNLRTDQKRTSCVAPWVTDVTFTTYTGVQTVKTIDDTAIPRFQSLLACGGFLPINPCTITTTKTTRHPGSGTSQSGFVGGCYRQRSVGPYWVEVVPVVATPPYDEGIIDTVVTSAIADAKAGVFDALTFVGELKETTKMVANSWDRINHFATRAARRARSLRGAKGGNKLLEAFSNYWLEYRLGWKPAIDSAEDALAAFASKVEAGALVRGKSKVVTSLNASGVVTTVDTTGTATKSTVIEGSRTYRGMAYAKVNNSNLHRFQVDPLVTTWELIPYSFVADYFIGIGNWLSAQSPFSGASLEGSGASVRDSYTCDTQRDKTYHLGGYTGFLNGIRTVIEVESYHRFPHDGGALPVWNPRLSPVRILNIAALVYLGNRRVANILR